MSFYDLQHAAHFSAQCFRACRGLLRNGKGKWIETIRYPQNPPSCGGQPGNKVIHRGPEGFSLERASNPLSRAANLSDITASKGWAGKLLRFW